MILNRQRRVRVPVKSLRDFLAHLGAEIGPGCEVTVCLVSDQAMRALNRRFRGKDRPTDVLSFSAQRRTRPLWMESRRREPAGIPRNAFLGDIAVGSRHRKLALTPVDGFLGDIAISPETARRNARRYGRSLNAELRILVLHGMLHLMGFDHETDNGKMANLEGRLRRRLGLS